MKKTGYWLTLFVFAFMGLLISVAGAQNFDFDLNVPSYQEGNFSIGKNLIVAMDEKTKVKYITGHQGIGKVRVSPISLSDEFEVIIKACIKNSSSEVYFFLISDESEIKISLGNYGFEVGLNDSGENSESWRQDAANDVRLHVSGNIAKLYVNDVFFHKVTLDKSDLTYTNFIMTGIREGDALYGLKWRNLQSGGSVPASSYSWGLGGDFDFDIGVSSYQEGNTGVGENLITAVDKQTGEKYFTGHEDIGKVRISPISLSGEFEFFIRTYIANSSTEMSFFLISGESEIKISLGNYGFEVGLNDSGEDSESWRQDAANDVRLHVSGNIAKLYVNDVFFHKVTLDKSDLTYTNFVMTGLREGDALYELKWRNLQSGGSVPTPSHSWGLDGNFDFALNVSSYHEGDTEIGENMIVAMYEETGIKYATGYQGVGNLDFSPISLSNEFEIFIRTYIANSSTEMSFFLISGESEIKISLGNYYFEVGLNDSGEDSISWRQDTANDVRLHVSGNVAKLYVNDVFFHKVTLDKSGLTYTKLTMTGIRENDVLFEVKGRNITGTATQASSLAVDFGDKGLYLYDGTAFTGLVGWNPDRMLSWKNRLVADFNDKGLWTYSGGTWSGIAGWNAENMTVWGDKLAADFGEKGLWIYDGSSWKSLADLDCENMQVWKNSLVGDFGGTGLWIYDGSTWTGLAGMDCENMQVWKDSLVADFGENGIWAYNGSKWTGLAGWNAENMVIWGDKLLADFGVKGLWTYSGSTWTGFVGWNAENMTVWGNKLLADFGGSGLWICNGSTWTGLVGWNAENMTVWGDKLLADFGSSGLWAYNGSSWTGLVGWDVENIQAIGF